MEFFILSAFLRIVHYRVVRSLAFNDLVLDCEGDGAINCFGQGMVRRYFGMGIVQVLWKFRCNPIFALLAIASFAEVDWEASIVDRFTYQYDQARFIFISADPAVSWRRADGTEDKKVANKRFGRCLEKSLHSRVWKGLELRLLKAGLAQACSWWRQLYDDPILGEPDGLADSWNYQKTSVGEMETWMRWRGKFFECGQQRRLGLRWRRRWRLSWKVWRGNPLTEAAGPDWTDKRRVWATVVEGVAPALTLLRVRDGATLEGKQVVEVLTVKKFMYEGLLTEPEKSQACIAELKSVETKRVC